MRKRAGLLLALGAAVLGATAQAAAFKASAVPASALWVCHLDAAGMKQSAAGRRMLEQRALTESLPIARFAERFGLDPVRDMRGLTLYTVSTGRQDAVAVIDPEPAAAVRLKAWREKAGWKAQAVDGHSVYSRLAGKETLFQSVAPNGLIVTAMTLAHVQRGLAVLDGRTPALESKTMPALVDRKGGAGVLLLVAARTPNAEMIQMLPQLTLLKTADSLCLAVGEEEGLVTGGVTVSAADEAGAVRLQNALSALIEFSRAMGSGQGPDPLRSISVTRVGGKVRADGRWTLDELMGILGMEGVRRTVHN